MVLALGVIYLFRSLQVDAFLARKAFLRFTFSVIIYVKSVESKNIMLAVALFE